MNRYQNTIETMVSIIKARPLITVRELAHELGFSEERSVYYWIKKAGHKGLRSFKRAVLASAGDSGSDHAPSTVSEGRNRLVTMTTYEYAPWILPGDELTVDLKRVPRDGELVFLSLPGDDQAVRRYMTGPVVMLLHPARPTDVLRMDPRHLTDADPAIDIIGPVVCVIRRQP